MSTDNTKKTSEQNDQNRKPGLQAPVVEEVPAADLDDVAGGIGDSAISCGCCGGSIHITDK